METLNKIDKRTSYVNFKIGTENYAISVYKVLEIIQLDQLTTMPNSSVYILGVLNFRGSVVPVIDMHKRFNTKGEDRESNMVIIVNIINNNNDVLMGLLVDEVTDVIEFEYKEINTAPNIGIKYNPEFLEGFVKKEEAFVMVLNVDKVLNVTELAEISETLVE